MERCVLCLNDTTVRNFSLDGDGVCNFCRAYSKIEDKLNDDARMQKLFLDRIERVRGKHAYDAAVGISGGKDSVYVLDQLVNVYHLKVKAFTMLNGFFSDEARENVDRLVAEFGVEHEYISFPSDMLQRFYRYTMSKWLVPCIACSYIGYASMINYASKIDAGICIHGRSPEQMLRAYGYDVFTEFVNAGLTDIEELDISATYTKILSDIGKKMDEQLMREIEGILLQDVKENDFREFVPYFLYHRYNEAQIVDYLYKNTSWQPKTDGYNHYDCKIHNASRYIYRCFEGRPHALPEVSARVRMGEITREEGMAILASDTVDASAKKELKELCRYAGVSPTLTLLKAKIYKRIRK